MTSQHWVWLETGGNQKYIFASDRLRNMIGGSQVIYDSGTRWVEDTIKEMTSSEPSGELMKVMATSGKALLRTESKELARAFITRITRRALAQAPGLQLTGTIGPAFNPALPANLDSTLTSPLPSGKPELDFHTALRETWAQHQKVRAARPAPAQRDPLLPWHEQCRDTGYPAAHYEPYGRPSPDGNIPEEQWHPASAAVHRRSTHKKPARERMAKILSHSISEVMPHFLSEKSSDAKSIPREIDMLNHDGWIAIIHADGNGVGDLFTNLVGNIQKLNTFNNKSTNITLDKFCDVQGAIAAELKLATENAVKIALKKTLQNLDWLDGNQVSEKYHSTFMPIIIGGDDVTIACHAAMALDFVQEFSIAFEQETAAHTEGTLAHLVGAMYGTAGPCGLTASAGVAIVKPHHPLSSAYHLAEELISKAKKAGTSVVSTTAESSVSGQKARKIAAVDFHILHESTLAPLDELRKELATIAKEEPKVFRHAGPYLLEIPAHPNPGTTPPLKNLLDLCEALDPELAQNSVERQAEADIAKPSQLSASRAHQLRAALDRSLEDYSKTLKLIEYRMRTDSSRTSAEAITATTVESSGAQLKPRLFSLLEPERRTDGNIHLLLADALLWHGIRAQPNSPATEQLSPQEHQK